MKIAQIQMHVSGDKTAGLRHAAELIRGAGRSTSRCCRRCSAARMTTAASTATARRRAARRSRRSLPLARERGIWLIGGSIPELEGGNVYNTSFVYAPDGSCARAPPQDAPL